MEQVVGQGGEALWDFEEWKGGRPREVWIQQAVVHDGSRSEKWDSHLDWKADFPKPRRQYGVHPDLRSVRTAQHTLLRHTPLLDREANGFILRWLRNPEVWRLVCYILEICWVWFVRGINMLMKDWCPAPVTRVIWEQIQKNALRWHSLAYQGGAAIVVIWELLTSQLDAV